MKLDAVFEGGGVKGIGLVGAICYVEDNLKPKWVNLAGTSAGAIIASLLAAGYTAHEIKNIMFNMDFNLLKDENMLSRFSIPGKLLSIMFKQGIYKGSYIENFMAKLLAAKGVYTFSDLIINKKGDPRYKFKLNVIASDITRGKLLVLPADIKDYGIAPEDLSVSLAVRMSMSIPIFYEPVILKTGSLPEMPQKCYIVDGGILSNYPVWLFDSLKKPEWPTIGFRLMEPDYGKPHNITNPLNFLLAIASTLQEAHDERYIQDSNFKRTVPIDTLGIKSTDFGLSEDERDMLFQSGYEAAQKFFKVFSKQEYDTDHPRFVRPNYLQAKYNL